MVMLISSVDSSGKKVTLNLKKASAKDLSDLLDLKNESWKATHRTMLSNIEDQISWFEKRSKDIHQPKQLTLIAHKEQIPIGLFALSNIDYISRTADVSWSIYVEVRKHGFGRVLVNCGCYFCFNVLGLRRISCEILENNEASKKCANHSGFVHEGTKRQSIFKDGVRLNSDLYGLLATEFTKS
jgi:RimJ/RimL family protein N-acetyltransferase